MFDFIDRAINLGMLTCFCFVAVAPQGGAKIANRSSWRKKSPLDSFYANRESDGLS
jgi:hypothetical protein